MFNKGKSIFALFLLTCLFLSMSFASANNITDIDEIVDDHPTKSFSDLNDKINDLNQTEIILDDDYLYQDECDKNFTEGIFINRSVTIDGQGHFIDANKSSRIFYINANNVTLKNITFKNGYSFFEGGAVFTNATNMAINNCMFINNEAFATGGAVFSNDSNTNIINSTFRDNRANFHGAAVCCMGLNTNIINSTFKHNLVYNFAGGSAISLSNGLIIDSNFIDNYQIKMFTGIYYYDVIINVVNESISYSEDLNGNVWGVVRSYNVTIINSTIKNMPTKEIHHNQPFAVINYNDTNGTNPTNNSSNVNKGHNDAGIVPVSTGKCSSIIVAKNKVFKKKLKTKRYSVVLKSKKGKKLKNTWITLKIKGKSFKAKTNGKGKATFKITKFYKKGNFKAVVKFKGNKMYKSVSKKVNIKIK